MTTIRLLFTALLLTQAVGCTWVKGIAGIDKNPKPTGGLPNVSSEQLVSYLNDRATKLRSVSYGEVRLRAYENGIVKPALQGTMAAAQPRSFRMVGEGRVAGKLDMGSNSDQFWIYLKAVGDPVYLVCSHSDFETGRAKLPGGIPFEPNWVMQALGMTHFPESNTYSVQPSEKDRTYTLWWMAQTPGGQSIRKEVVFDADTAIDGRPQVKKHLMRDAKSNEVLVTAEIKKVATTTSEPGSRQAALQYPTSLVLKWTAQKFELDLSLEQAKINQPLTEEQNRRLFSRPEVKGTNPIDLAKYESGS